MIKINLLDYRKEKVHSKIQMQIAVAVLLLVLVFALAGLLSTMQGSRISGLNEKITKKNQELSALAHVETKVTESEKMQKRLEDIVNTIMDLKKKQKEPARLYHEMFNRRLPPGEMWLAKVTEMPDRIVLEGDAFRDSAISAFMESLEKMGAFPDVSLEYVRQKEIQGRKVKTFKINCLYSSEGIYVNREWAKTKMPGGIYGMGGAVEDALSRKAAFEYGQQLGNELKQMPRNPLVESGKQAGEKTKQ